MTTPTDLTVRTVPRRHATTAPPLAGAVAPCACEPDPELDILRTLVTAGHGQHHASRILWGPHGAATLARAGWEARQTVRTALTARLPWLRLPPAAGTYEDALHAKLTGQDTPC